MHLTHWQSDKRQRRDVQHIYVLFNAWMAHLMNAICGQLNNILHKLKSGTIKAGWRCFSCCKLFAICLDLYYGQFTWALNVRRVAILSKDHNFILCSTKILWSTCPKMMPLPQFDSLLLNVKRKDFICKLMKWNEINEASVFIVGCGACRLQICTAGLMATFNYIRLNNQ